MTTNHGCGGSSRAEAQVAGRSVVCPGYRLAIATMDGTVVLAALFRLLGYQKERGLYRLLLNSYVVPQEFPRDHCSGALGGEPLNFHESMLRVSHRSCPADLLAAMRRMLPGSREACQSTPTC